MQFNTIFTGTESTGLLASLHYLQNICLMLVTISVRASSPGNSFIVLRTNLIPPTASAAFSALCVLINFHEKFCNGFLIGHGSVVSCSLRTVQI